MKKQKGISLIVLVITIIVIIILAGAVILSLANNNPIMSANEAKFRSDMQSIQSQLNLYISSKLTETLGTYDVNTMNGEVSAFVPGVTQYDADFDIVKGKLTYTGNDAQNVAYLRSMNLDMNTKYNGTAEIVTPTTNVINKSEGTVESWVNVTSSMRNEVADKYIFSTYADEKYTNTLALRHTRDNKWQAIMSSDYNQISDIAVADNLSEGWHLFSLKWNSSEFSLFIDGSKVATTISPKLMQAVATNMYIGSGPKLNLVKNGYVTTGDNTNFGMLSYITTDSFSAAASLQGNNQLFVESNDFISVDPNKVYYQSGQFKSLKVGTISNSYYGITTYDKDKNYINDFMTCHFTNTETELAQDLKPGDTVVYVKSAVNWKKSTDNSSLRFIAIYPYKDYPVYTYTRNYYAFNDSNTTNNTVTLSSPYSGPLLSAGTKVANNYNGPGTYTYNTLCGTVIPNTWTKYTSTISGNIANSVSSNQFRYGTAYIRIMMLLNWYNNAGDTILSDDIEFKDNAGVLYNSKIQEVCISNIARSDNDIAKRYASGVLNKDSNVTFLLSEQ